MQEGCPPQRAAIGQRLGALGGVENELDLAVLDGIDDMGPALEALLICVGGDAVLDQEALRPGGGDDLEAELASGVFTAARMRASLSASRTDTNTVPVRGSREPPPSWLLAKAISNERSIPMTSPVDRISGPEHGVDAGEAREREHRLLDPDMIEAAAA